MSAACRLTLPDYDSYAHLLCAPIPYIGDLHQRDASLCTYTSCLHATHHATTLRTLIQGGMQLYASHISTPIEYVSLALVVRP